MGEIADMMLEGELCEGCGEYLGGGDGFPGLCAGCAQDRESVRDTGLGYYQDMTPHRHELEHVCDKCGKAFRKKHGLACHLRDRHGIGVQFFTNCPECGKKVKKVGLKDHMRDAHGVAS